MLFADLALLILLLPFASALLQILIKKFSLAYYLSCITAIFIVIISFFLYQHLNIPGNNISYVFGNLPASFGIELIFNTNNTLIILCFAVIFLSSIISAYNDLKQLNKYKNIALILSMKSLAFMGFVGMVCTNDIFNLYVFLEIASIASYVLVAINFPEQELISLKTSFNYLIIGSLGAVFYLFGVGIFYGATGTLNLTDLRNFILDSPHINPSLILGSIMVAMGCLIKCAIFPFHGWLLKLYRNSLTPVTVFLAGISSKTVIFVLFKYYIYIFNAAPAITSILYFVEILALISILYGSLMSVMNDDLMNTISYSSISQVGYIILAISHSLFDLAVIFFINHALGKAALFLFTGQDHSVKHLNSAEEIITIEDQAHNLHMKNKLNISNILQDILLIVILGILFGLPFTIAFMAKITLLKTFLSNNLFLLGFLLFNIFLSFLYTKKIFLEIKENLYKKIFIIDAYKIFGISILIIFILYLTFNVQHTFDMNKIY